MTETDFTTRFTDVKFTLWMAFSKSFSKSFFDQLRLSANQPKWNDLEMCKQMILVWNLALTVSSPIYHADADMKNV